MRIASSSLQLTSTHLQERNAVREESVRLRVGDPSAGRPGPPAAAPSAPPAPAGVDGGEGGAEEEIDPERLSARDRLDLAILRRTFGLERDLTQDARDARNAYRPRPTGPPSRTGRDGQDAAGREGWGLRYDLVETSIQQETTAFAAQGQILTSEGRQLSVQAALTMERTQVDVHEVHLRAGDAEKVDPLVLNLAGGAAGFSGQTSLDLDLDGKQETVARLAAGSAYLSLDRNGNGKVDSGAELLGPSTGSGFGELAALDQDGNGWVDEGDEAFDSLRLWDQAAGTLRTLRAAGVGAIYTRAAATAFEVKGADGALQGSVAQTGLFLREDGSAGMVQHLDLVV